MDGAMDCKGLSPKQRWLLHNSGRGWSLLKTRHGGWDMDGCVDVHLDWRSHLPDLCLHLQGCALALHPDSLEAGDVSTPQSLCLGSRASPSPGKVHRRKRPILRSLD